MIVSVEEIMRRYALHPPLFVANSIRMGRPSKKTNNASLDTIISMQKLFKENSGTQRDFRKIFSRITNCYPENFTRPLSVDETVLLCNTLGLRVESVIWDIRGKKEKDI